MHKRMNKLFLKIFNVPNIDCFLLIFIILLYTPLVSGFHKKQKLYLQVHSGPVARSMSSYAQ